jgi:hypothetical protein
MREATGAPPRSNRRWSVGDAEAGAAPWALRCWGAGVSASEYLKRADFVERAAFQMDAEKV